MFYSIQGFGDDGLLTSLDFSMGINIETGADNIEDGDTGIMYERLYDAEVNETFKLFHSIETVTPPIITGIREEEELTPQEQAAEAFKVAEQAMDAIERGNGLQLKSALDQMSDVIVTQLAGVDLADQLQRAMDEGINIGDIGLLLQGDIITQTSIDDLASGLNINIGSFTLDAGLGQISISRHVAMASLIQTNVRSMI